MSQKVAGAGCPDTAPATAAVGRITPAAADPDRPSRALAWRRSKGLTRADLAQLTGYSPSVIADMEAGARRGKAPQHAAIDEAAWLRYALACAAIEAGAALPF